MVMITMVVMMMVMMTVVMMMKMMLTVMTMMTMGNIVLLFVLVHDCTHRSSIRELSNFQGDHDWWQDVPSFVHSKL